jgi:CheY-like chemotaxis protein
MAVPASARRPRTVSPLLRGLRILIVEDHDDSRAMLAQMVASTGARPMVAADGREALEMLATARPHLILCDLRMPDLDGFTLAERIRTDAQNRALPLVAVTALSEPEDYLRTLEAGFDAHLPKPVEFDTLLTILSRFAAQARRRRR